MDLSKFEALEVKVKAIVQKMSDLTAEKEALAKTLEETKAELAASQSLAAELQAERSAILAKVDSILERLD